MKIEFFPYVLNLINHFTLSRHTSNFREVVFVKITHNEQFFFGEAAPNHRYNETQAQVIQELNTFNGVLTNDWQKRVKLSSTSCALQNATFNVTETKNNFLKITTKKEAAPTSYTLSIDSKNNLLKRLDLAKDFRILKIKLGNENDLETLKFLRKHTEKPFRIDANEGWTFEKAKFLLQECEKLNVELIEQPLPASQNELTAKLKNYTKIPLAADESLSGNFDLKEISECFDVVNLKCQKFGGILNTQKIAEKSLQLGLKLMVGCMIESSLGIFYASLLSSQASFIDLDGHLLISNDPFAGLLQVEDGKITIANQNQTPNFLEKKAWKH
ncbi:hypothetical protein IT568_03520 [bacterium]|nr:hypothetical protein [bacterium]